MPPESWIAPDDVPVLAADATARIDAALHRLPETDRAAFWASVRKCYNTPYNYPKPRKLPEMTAALREPEGCPEPQQVAGSSQGFGAAVLAVALAAIPGGGFAPEAQPA